jgi:hypothetical protein
MAPVQTAPLWGGRDFDQNPATLRDYVVESDERLEAVVGGRLVDPGPKTFGGMWRSAVWNLPRLLGFSDPCLLQCTTT